MKILFAAGGSIGHIAPCVAVWRSIQETGAGAKALFVCSSRTEDQEFLRREGEEYCTLGGRNVRIWTLPMMLLRAWRMLVREKPDIIFTKGGGVTVPIALTGWMKGIPVIVHESDAISGRATRWLSGIATRVIHGFPGNPVRSEVLRGSKERGLALTGLSGSRPILLVMGGSQGAMTLNDAVTRNLDALLTRVDIVHITGAGKSGGAPRAGRYWTCAFAQEDYPHLLAITDIALCRAGAGSISELAGTGIAAVLVPLRGLAHDHQEKNARALEEKHACIVLEQSVLDRELLPTVSRLSTDLDMRKQLRENIRTLADLDASKKAAEIILAIARDHGVTP